MKNAYKSLPCYAGDVSGVCSALYELGGMVVIHDPSGCNSTYNTHDETRWYDQDSMIYISGLSETDAILGADETLVTEVTAAARTLRPAFVALACSPIPYLTGTDLPALARLIEQDTGIPSFFVPTNGMRDYLSGVGGAFEILARRFVGPTQARTAHTVNVLGLTPLDFAAEGTVASLEAVLAGGGWQVVSRWAMGSSLAELSRAAQAEVNLVVSAAGLAAARVLRQRFGTPFVAALPVGDFAQDVLAALDAAARDGQSRVPYLERPTQDAAVALLGEPVTMGSLAAAITRRWGLAARVLCPLEADACLLGAGDRMPQGEEALSAALAGAAHVVADPMYRPVVPAAAQFHPLPHLAFSGRCYLREMKDLVRVL